MSAQKKCIFVASRNCPFQTNQVTFSTCQLCVEAWKTEVALMREQSRGVQSPKASPKKLTLPVIETGGSVFLNQKLKEIDELLKNDNIDPLEYIQLRKQHINNLIGEKQGKLNEEQDIEPEKKSSKPRELRIAIISKSLLRKKIHTIPPKWELPQDVSDKVIDTIFDMAKTKKAEDIKLRAGEYKIACISVEKNKLALMIFGADEEFEDYDSVRIIISELLRREKNWEEAVDRIRF